MPAYRHRRGRNRRFILCMRRLFYYHPSQGFPVVTTPPNSSQSPSEPPLVIQSTAIDRTDNPDLDLVRSATLRDSKRVRKEAVYVRVTDRHTGEYHHEALTLTTTRKLKAGDTADPKHSIGLTTEEGDDEIQKLVDFIQVVRTGAVPAASAKYVVLPAHAGANAEQLANLVQSASAAGKAGLLADVLAKAIGDRALFDAILTRAARDPDLFAHAAAALNLAAYRQAVTDLETLVATSGAKEHQFQQILTKNPWMFGSEYSELLDRRKWTRDEQQDFVVRRTTDGYIELIEIKTPLDGAALFQFDRSHDSYYAGAELSKVVGQVEKYLELLDADRHRIQASDHEDTNKIRAKVVIGRDGNAKQNEALRRFVGHLHRIEVITFDQLLRIARRVLGYLEHAVAGDRAIAPLPTPAPLPDDGDPIPF
ncbi:MAG: DUF4263 domain-containing protein [Planctomycetaceae bacterium]|nr:DUF4263 domain-containing protein [Planctomycetaceae bacterium]